MGQPAANVEENPQKKNKFSAPLDTACDEELWVMPLLSNHHFPFNVKAAQNLRDVQNNDLFY